mmetsp:Transcript_2334/g.2983  ORF Transcript_2334/g.2983 Transcript_2334/m.2983 type:complete len:344 (-) Transcript_2334:1202-2233(-)|eukprot:CAMPEP_0204824264 /NCGR_PEP_ID=MMETSP1346-20131115/2292_1 /ASSEMBLY_ACC=CAM_ASM_000771 /TAXON_ID=215587 /ORGANISM="Aplanochytrium stocchinoi, Strain GSBS06" /LENGTH=343 /DNA_ID=CAMNT_0051951317 /DNA_START=254 /DNA_END=1285 /DNA_ORIENTATION=+
MNSPTYIFHEPNSSSQSVSTSLYNLYTFDYVSVFALAMEKRIDLLITELTDTFHCTNRTSSFLLGLGLALGCVGATKALTMLYANVFESKKPSNVRTLSHLHHLDLSMIKRNLAIRNLNFGNENDNDVNNEDDQEEEIHLAAPVYKIVLTGGPCAGKSSAIEYFAKKVREKGYDVYQVPEVPTLLMNGGCMYPGLNGGDKLIAFETSLIELQLQMEQTFYNVAQSSGRPSVILYDRGLLDVAAYVPRDLWSDVLYHNQWLRDGMLGVLQHGRYDLILHMESAACGAEKYYQVRKETIEEARDLDKKIKGCWRGHPHHRIVDNSTDFKGKLERALEHVLRLLNG